MQDNSLYRKCFYIQNFYIEQIFRQKPPYTEKFLYVGAFIHRHFYTQTLSHTDAFTHRSFYTQTLLHIDAITHKSFYTQTLLHRNGSQSLLHTDGSQLLLHTEAFTHRPAHAHAVTVKLSFWWPPQYFDGGVKFVPCIRSIFIQYSTDYRSIFQTALVIIQELKLKVKQLSFLQRR